MSGYVKQHLPILLVNHLSEGEDVGAGLSNGASGHAAHGSLAWCKPGTGPHIACIPTPGPLARRRTRSPVCASWAERCVHQRVDDVVRRLPGGG